VTSRARQALRGEPAAPRERAAAAGVGLTSGGGGAGSGAAPCRVSAGAGGWSYRLSTQTNEPVQLRARVRRSASVSFIWRDHGRPYLACDGARTRPTALESWRASPRTQPTSAGTVPSLYTMPSLFTVPSLYTVANHGRWRRRRMRPCRQSLGLRPSWRVRDTHPARNPCHPCSVPLPPCFHFGFSALWPLTSCRHPEPPVCKAGTGLALTGRCGIRPAGIRASGAPYAARVGRSLSGVRPAGIRSADSATFSAALEQVLRVAQGRGEGRARRRKGLGAWSGRALWRGRQIGSPRMGDEARGGNEGE
jgi:hypothetical protein